MAAVNINEIIVNERRFSVQTVSRGWLVTDHTLLNEITILNQYVE